MSNYKNREFEKFFQLDNNSNKNQYLKRDSINISYRRFSKVSDTLSFYLNNSFLFNKILESSEKISIPLHESQFGVNVLEVMISSLTANVEHRFSVFPESPQVLKFKILEEYKHDIKDFTQGLIVKGNIITESTGGYGTSELKKYNYLTGKEDVKVKLDKKYFGEGITNYQDKIYLLTYKEKEILIFDEQDLELIDVIPYHSQGWGITHDNRYLIISNGTSELNYVDPESFQNIRVLKVFNDEGEVKNLNELEYINGEIYANVWFKNEIAVINPESGAVTKKIIFSDLNKIQKNGILTENVFNGIAYDKESNSLFITGKRWPVLYKVKVED